MDAIVTSASVLTIVKQMLRLSDTTDHDIYLESLINSGARRLGTTETLIIKNCTATATDSRFYLPKDCKELLAFRSKDSCVQGTFVATNFFTQCGCNSLLSSAGINYLSNLINIEGRWAYLQVSVPDGTEFEIAYSALNTDEDGMMVINEEQQIAIENYASWKFAISYPENYTRSQWEDWKNDFTLQSGKCRGLAARRSFKQSREQIKSKIHQMVNTGVSLSLFSGVYPSFYYPTITSI